jgi:hypothetical protein
VASGTGSRCRQRLRLTRSVAAVGRRATIRLGRCRSRTTAAPGAASPISFAVASATASLVERLKAPE